MQHFRGLSMEWIFCSEIVAYILQLISNLSDKSSGMQEVWFLIELFNLEQN